MTGFIFTVHAIWVSSDGIEQGCIEFAETDERKASNHARLRSGGAAVTAAMVQRLRIGQIGTRTVIEWWIKGVKHTMADPQNTLPPFVPEQLPDGLAGRG